MEIKKIERYADEGVEERSNRQAQGIYFRAFRAEIARAPGGNLREYGDRL